MPTEEKEKKKQPTVKTLEDKGTKIDYVDFGDGRQAFLYQTEKFRGLGIGAFKLGWTNKFNVISPSELSHGTLTAMSTSATMVSGSPVKPEDFIVYSLDEKKQEEKKKKEKSQT